ncbi:MAG: type II secretion system F family protein [Selenomonadaceae bacterium]|nr:type II secretion system F family protein [Selenomonadaceae bacterium]
MKIKRFSYEAYDKDKTFQTGELNANDVKEAYVVLQNQGLAAVEIKEVQRRFLDNLLERIEQVRVGNKWTALFFRQLSTTLDVMHLKASLDLLLLSTKDKSQQAIIKSILSDIEVGKTLADALSKYRLIFSDNIIQMMIIAQRSGRMQEISEKLAEQLEKDYKSRQKLRSALYYPTFVLIAAMISITILINVVLPVFANFFQSQNASLPILTQIFLTAGIFLSQNMLLIFILLIILSAGCVWIYKNSPSVQLYFDQYLLKVPLIGQLISQKEWMNSFGSLSFLLESGVQIDEAIGMVANASSNSYIKEVWTQVKYKVEQGGRLQSESFPAEYQGLITTGESSGTLPDMLKKCEKLSEFEVEELSSQLPVKAEIFGTLFVGIIVALIVFSVILPILSINI